MSVFYKNVYKGLPVKIKVRKPRFYYKDEIVKFDENSEYNIDLEPFEGLEYEFDNYSIGYKNKMLWDYSVVYGNKLCFAPKGNDYLFVDDEQNVQSLSGCLNEGSDEGSETKYYVFAKDKNIILSKTSDDIDDYVYAGEVVVPEHEVGTFYVKNYFEPNNSLVYSYGEDGHIWCNLNSNGELTAKDEVFVGIDAGQSFHNYSIVMSMKVVADDVSGYRKLFMFEGMNWFGTNSGKLCIYDKLTADAALTAGVVYRIYFREDYNFATATYTRTLGYIKDEDFVVGSSENNWITKSVSSSSPWLTSSVKLIGIGADETNNRSWKGSIDLMYADIRFIMDGYYDVIWSPLD